MKLFNYSILTALIFTFSACNLFQGIEPSKPETSTASITLNSDEYLLSDNKELEAVGGNSNCGKLHFYAALQDNGLTKVALYLSLLESGELEKVRLVVQENRIYKQYLTHFYNPVSSFSISNFSYDKSSGNVIFDFNGTLYYENQNDETIAVSGRIDVKSLKDISCGIAETGIFFNSASFQFNSVYTAIQEQGSQYTYLFHSNNGLALELLTNRDLWSLDLGSYSFNTSTIENRVILKRFNGGILAGQIIDPRKISWEILDTQGSFTITDKQVIKGQKVVNGEMNIQIINNGTVSDNIKSINFTTWAP